MAALFKKLSPGRGANFSPSSITTDECAYDRTRYGHILNWDKHCLYIHGRPMFIISGEFHYWRVPDRSRWGHILKKYRAGGFNCIRIYFHWGFHSPDEGVYNFEGNQDVDYLLTLCEQLKLFVLAAPGPYICAETQAGGFPFWVVAKKKRLRNMWFTGFKRYDPEFCEYEREWFKNILPILACHQITAKSNGCLIGVQIENELFEKVKGIFSFGLPDEMRFLCKVAREEGITVPLFTNDPEEAGSWIARSETDRKRAKNFFPQDKFGLDLYGFDKYVVFVPASAPVAWANKANLDPKKWAPWKPEEVMRSVDNLEKTVRNFGFDAAKSPLFIPELQGGWFSFYQLDHTFDDIYDFYGDNYTRLLYESTLAQGLTMSSIYMVYGGTNWGTLGDTDAYTSYDYSACIREYGYLSGRLRNLRLTNHFVQSFSDVFSKTERVKKPFISASIEGVINLQRQTIADEKASCTPPLFTFLRNFSKDKRAQFQICIDYKDIEGPINRLWLQCFLPYKTSFIALGNYTTITGLKLIMSTLPIHIRTFLPASEDQPVSEIWIIPANHLGELAFEGMVIVDGNISPTVRINNQKVYVVLFNGLPGYARIRRHNEDNRILYVLALDNEALGTLHAVFDDPHWAREFESPHSLPHSPLLVTWGTQNVFYDHESATLETEFGEDEKEITLICPHKNPSNFHSYQNETYPLPFIYTKRLTPNDIISSIQLTTNLDNWRTRVTNFSDLEWQITDLKKTALDHFYISGHILYRARFNAQYTTRSGALNIRINMRHRCTIFMNGRFVGGHTTYSRQLFFPGAKAGPELFSSYGTQKYNLTEFAHPPGNPEQNEIIIVVENLGLCRQAIVFNDAPNPRGILYARLNGVKSDNKIEWAVSGIDVRRLETPFITSGFSDEHKRTGWIDHVEGINGYGVEPSDGIRWWSFQFKHPVDEAHKNTILAPLRIVLQGNFSSYIFLNGTLIGRYYGNGDSSQHDFYLMDGLLNHAEENQIVLMVYTWEVVTKEQIKIEIRGWEVDDVHKTGNLIRLRDGARDEYELKSWIVWRDVFSL